MAMYVFLLLALVQLVTARLSVQGDHFMYNGQRVFLSGGNLAWINYARDFGDHQWDKVKSQVENQLRMLRDAGGNSLRLWIHIQGESSPAFDNNGYVTGMDHQGTFANDFKALLNMAQRYNILVFPTLWNGAVNQDDYHRLDGLIVDSRKLQSYIDKVLTPLVHRVKGHPALGAWDVWNEPEGLIIPNRHHNDKCYDTTALANSGLGWAAKKYKYEDILRFVNWQAAAIKSEDPGALVTMGVFNPKSNTDQFGMVNHYTDSCLVKAGGKSNGKLDFWQFHSYAWQGNFDNVSPFKHSYSDYRTNKPIVVGEFWAKDGGGLNINAMFDYVYNHGYAGAWSWDLVKEGGNQRGGIAHIKGYTHHGVIPIRVQ